VSPALQFRVGCDASIEKSLAIEPFAFIRTAFAR
jgi:hypothetical protein